MSEEVDLALEEWLGVLAELWRAAGKPLEADRLQVYRQSLGEVPLGLLELASSATRPTGIPSGYDVLRDVAETAAPRGCFANGGLSHGDASLMPHRLVAAGDPGKCVSRGTTAGCGVGGGAMGVGGAVGCEAGDGGLGREEVGEGGKAMIRCQPTDNMGCRTIKATNPTHFFVGSSDFGARHERSESGASGGRAAIFLHEPFYGRLP